MSKPLVLSVTLLAACAAPQTEPGAEPLAVAAGPTHAAPAHRPARFAPDLAARPARRVVEPIEARSPSLAQQLRDTRLPRFQARQEESLRAVVDRIHTFSGLPLVVAPTAEDACFDEGVVFDLDLAQPIRVVDLLNLIEEQSGDLVRWGIRHDAVIFVSAQKALATARVMRLYDIRTLTFARTDFTGPRIDRLRLLDELEDDDGGGPFGGLGERVSQTTPDEVVDLVQTQVASGTWSEDGVSIDHSQGLLIVVHTREVQAQVRSFLQRLGAF